MKRIVRVALACTLTMALVPASVGAGIDQKQVVFGDDCFVSDDADTVSVNDQTGGEIAFTRAPMTCGVNDEASGPHNAVQNKRLFDSGPAEDTFDEYEVQLSAGSFGYYCSLHGSPGEGMRGLVKAVPQISLLTADEVSVQWSNSQATTGNRYRVQYRREGASKWRDWKQETKSFGAVFGRNDKPVALNQGGASFQVRARSFRKGNPKRRSGYSPPINLTR